MCRAQCRPHPVLHRTAAGAGDGHGTRTVAAPRPSPIFNVADHAVRDLFGAMESVSQLASSIRDETTNLAAAQIAMLQIAMLAFRKRGQGAVSMPDGITLMSIMRTLHYPIDRLATRPHQAQRPDSVPVTYRSKD